MITKKIISLCKKSGVLHLFDSDGVQWISDGAAIYPLFDLPWFDEETLCKAYDIPEKTAEKMLIKHDNSLPSFLNVADTTPEEMPCEYGEAIFERAIPITTSHGMEFIDKKYLSPFADADPDLLGIFERTGENGQTVFAVKQGFCLVGFIMPYDCINEKFVNRLKDICRQCEITLFNKNSKEMNETEK